MPASTLAQVRQALPAVRLKQTYGLTEIGIVATQSRDSSSHEIPALVEFIDQPHHGERFKKARSMR